MNDTSFLQSTDTYTILCRYTDLLFFYGGCSITQRPRRIPSVHLIGMADACHVSLDLRLFSIQTQFPKVDQALKCNMGYDALFVFSKLAVIYRRVQPRQQCSCDLFVVILSLETEWQKIAESVLAQLAQRSSARLEQLSRFCLCPLRDRVFISVLEREPTHTLPGVNALTQNIQNNSLCRPSLNK